MRTVIALLGAAALCVGCQHPPPPSPPPPPPPPPPAAPVAQQPQPPPPTPPAPPKCEALSEACTGQSGTHARIRQSGLSIVVPDGWMYAQQDDATVATSNAAILVVTSYDAGADAKTTEANRDAAFEALVKLLGVTPLKHKIGWTHANRKTKVGDMEMSFWQANDTTKDDKKGAVLVFGAQLSDKSWILGGGFDPVEDPSDADKVIMTAIESIAPTPASP